MVESPAAENGYSPAPHVEAVGTLLPIGDIAGWAKAWDRERRRGWVCAPSAVRTFIAIDPESLATIFAKQMQLLPEARTPGLDERSDSITEVQSPEDVGYYPCFLNVGAATVSREVTAPDVE